MANTHGFEVVAELAPPVLLQMMQAAWKSGGTPGTPGTIPQNFNIPPGLQFGPYTVQDGQVQIPQSGLGVQMAPDVNGVELQFDLQVQVQLQNPPVAQAGMIGFDANATAKVPIGPLAGGINVGILLAGLPRANVNVTLPGGDPIAPDLDAYITDYVHQLYQADGPSFPHQVSQTGQSLIVYAVDATLDLYDDPTDPAHQIQVTFPAGQVQIAIPVHLKIYDIVNNQPNLAPDLLDPMGVEAQLVLTAALTEAPGSVSVNLPAAVVTVQNLVPAGPAYGNEGANYSANKAQLAIFVNLDTIISSSLQQQGQMLVQQLNAVSFNYPTVAQIETFIGDQFYQQLVGEGSLSIWTPETGGASPIQVNNVTVVVLSDALVIALNSTAGANAGLLTNFIPAGFSFAIALSGDQVISIIQQTIHSPQSEGGFGTTFPNPPMVFHNVDHHDVRLTSLTPSLTNAIHMSGDVTVINAILGSIDVDASFDVDIGLDWRNNPDGSQMLHADPGTPDVHLSGLAWLLSILIGLITFGVVGVIIAIVVTVIVQNIASRIGSSLVVNQVTNTVTGIGAWPSELIGIGTIDSQFENPITISPDGLLFGG
jgi:hypothetical protein